MLDTIPIFATALYDHIVAGDGVNDHGDDIARFEQIVIAARGGIGGSYGQVLRLRAMGVDPRDIHEAVLATLNWRNRGLA